MDTAPRHPAAAGRLSASTLRQNWTPALHAVANTDAFVHVQRYRATAAVLVPAWWHRHASRLLDPGAPVKEMGSEPARAEISQLLTEAAEHGRHCVITVSGYRVAALAPQEWVSAARGAMGGAETSGAREVRARRALSSGPTPAGEGRRSTDTYNS